VRAARGDRRGPTSTAIVVCRGEIRARALFLKSLGSRQKKAATGFLVFIDFRLVASPGLKPVCRLTVS
jgi:hypothetical protein